MTNMRKNWKMRTNEICAYSLKKNVDERGLLGNKKSIFSRLTR